jgi:drug/metabolite transporter (DMT)-like permease
MNDDLQHQEMLLHKKSTRKGMLFAFGAAVFYSFIPIISTISHAGAMPVSTLQVYRFFPAACIFALYCLFTKRSLLISRKDIPFIAAGSLFYSGQSFFFFTCFQYVAPAIGEAVFSINPILVLILTLIFLKEKASKGKIITSLLAIGGVVLILYAPSTVAIRFLGILCAFLASCCGASYIVWNKKFTAHIEAPVLATYLAIGCGLFFLVMSTVTGQLFIPTEPSQILYIVILVIFSTVLGFFFFLMGIRLLHPGLMSIIGLSEPVFTITWAYFLFGQMLTLWQFVGMGILIFAIYRFEKIA